MKQQFLFLPMMANDNESPRAAFGGNVLSWVQQPEKLGGVGKEGKFAFPFPAFPFPPSN